MRQVSSEKITSKFIFYGRLPQMFRPGRLPPLLRQRRRLPGLSRLRAVPPLWWFRDNLMQPDKRFNFHALVTGEGKSKFLVISGQELDLENIPGVQALVSRARRADLVALLQAQSGQAIARQWGVSDKLISRLKNALGLGQGHGGDRRSGQVVRWSGGQVVEGSDGPQLPDTPTIQVIGGGQRQVIVIGSNLEFELILTGNILIEKNEAVRAQFRLWLENTTISDAAAQLVVARNVILWSRKYMGIEMASISRLRFV